MCRRTHLLRHSRHSCSDWDDDDFESPAPLPAHERVWRHPSEAGAEAYRYDDLVSATARVDGVPDWAGRGTLILLGALAAVQAAIEESQRHLAAVKP